MQKCNFQTNGFYKCNVVSAIKNVVWYLSLYLRSDLMRRPKQRFMFSSSRSSASILNRIASCDAGPWSALENPIVCPFNLNSLYRLSSYLYSTFYTFDYHLYRNHLSQVHYIKMLKCLTGFLHVYQ